MKDIKISIIIPVYRAQSCIAQCIQSILSQTFQNWEAILIDDGSPDNSGKICDEFSCKDSRIKVFHKTNGGVSSARNLGLDKATGDFVTFVDSDDYIGPSYLEFFATKSDFDLIFTGIHRVGSVDYTMFGEEDIVYSTSIDLLTAIKKCSDEKNLSLGGLSFVACKALRRSIIEDNHIRFNTAMKYGEDTTMVNNFLLYIKNAIQVKGNEYYYETPAVSHVFKMEFNEMEEHIRLYRKAICRLEHKYNLILQIDIDSYIVSVFTQFFKTYISKKYSDRCTVSRLYKVSTVDYMKLVKKDKGSIKAFICRMLLAFPSTCLFLKKIIK